MTDDFISLLYPQGYSKETNSAAVNEAIISALSAESLFTVIKNAFRFKLNPTQPLEYFTDEPEVIRYRLDVVEDLMDNDALYGLFSRLIPEFEDMKETFMIDKGPQDDTTAALYSITLIELYTSCIDKIYSFFQKETIKLRSSGL